MSLKDKNSSFRELIRFLICGVAAALTDYLFAQLTILIINKIDPSTSWIVATIISTAVGFVFGVIVNYLISTFWVYQNVDKSVQTKSKKFIALFVLLSFLAMVLSILTMLLCNLFVMNVMHQESIMELSLMTLIKENGWMFLSIPIFWTYFVSFVLKTLVGLIFNYFTRKYIWYKAPKEEKSDSS